MPRGLTGPTGPGAATPRARHLTAARDALAAALRRRVRGEVRFDAGERALYATDASNYRQVPIGIVRPRDREDLEAVVAVCREHDAPITLRGAGTSLAGQACNVAVVVDCSRHLTRILELDPDARTATVEPGVVLDDLRAAARAHGLTFGPDPATHDRCTIGGMLGNDSCGVHSIMSGRTSDNVASLDVLTYDGLRLRARKTGEAELAGLAAERGRRGELYASLRDIRDRHADEIRERFPPIPRLISGYALDRLLPERGFDLAAALVGTEGTCATILSATLRLVPEQASRALLLVGYPDVFAAADAVPAVLESKPIGLEGVTAAMFEALRAKRLFVDDLALFPDGGAWLLAEYGADEPGSAEDAARAAVERLAGQHPAPATRILASSADQARAWRVRESALGAVAQAPGQPTTWPGWEDSAVPPARLGDYLRQLTALLGRFEYHHALYGHFGQGCVHLRVDFDFRSQAGTDAFRRFVGEAADLVVGFGGSLSGEHGDGQARAELLPRMFGPTLVAAFEDFKAAWDPRGRMNPGKVVQPRRLDADLRLAGLAGVPAAPSTTFRFPEDRGSLALASLRCVGVGACRREEGGIMCPSFQATREERHSTRGRAHLLYEMLRGEVIEEGWRSREVKDVLDLCLACKGCLGECPVRVDMATYKAEFLSHFYAGRLRPRSAYALNLIPWWVRLAALAPGLVNAAAAAPLLRDVVRTLVGIDGRRQLPRFAGRTFRAQLAGRQRLQPAVPQRLPGPSRDRRRVVLWPDTFNDHFRPQTALAGHAVLEAAGYEVEVPSGAVCCGRPLYDAGFLDQARRLLRGSVRALGPAIDAGLPVVVLEPSCASVFRGELVGLFPNDERADWLSQRTFTLGEFLADHAATFPLRRLGVEAVYHGHCHQKALAGTGGDEAMLRRVGIAATAPEEGCCGMAGAFGFEAGEHCDLSLTLGERSLAPAVRSAAPEALIVADGFSCREQVEQLTGRPTLHLAEVLARALPES